MIGFVCAHDGRLASNLADVADSEFWLNLPVTLLEESGNLDALARATASLARLESLDTLIVAEHFLILSIERKHYLFAEVTWRACSSVAQRRCWVARLLNHLIGWLALQFSLNFLSVFIASPEWALASLSFREWDLRKPSIQTGVRIDYPIHIILSLFQRGRLPGIMLKILLGLMKNVRSFVCSRTGPG